MRPELLQPLLLDRALGELSPEVAALLDEYLARDPQAARLAADLDHTLVFARAAIRRDPELAPPALDTDLLQRIAQSERAATRRSQWFQLAACLALGAVAGWLARPAAVLSPKTSPTPAPTYAVSPAATTADSAGLWSRSRIVAEHADNRPAPRAADSRYPARSPFAPHSSHQDKL